MIKGFLWTASAKTVTARWVNTLAFILRLFAVSACWGEKVVAIASYIIYPAIQLGVRYWLYSFASGGGTRRTTTCTSLALSSDSEWTSLGAVTTW
jgi:hypothetical protein